MKKYFLLFFIVIQIFTGCLINNNIEEMEDSYKFNSGMELTVILITPLSSNHNKRGQIFRTKLKDNIIFNNKVLIPKGTEIAGLIKNVIKHEKFGDKSGFSLIFDQVILNQKRLIPISASIDESKGNSAVKIPGQTMQNTRIVAQTSTAGGMAQKQGVVKGRTGTGLILGGYIGIGANLITSRKETKLPVNTEISIKLNNDTYIRKEYLK